MSYIGATPTSTAFLTDSFSGDGSTTSFTLSAAPASSSSILVAVSGVLQDPATYAVVGTALNFTGAPPSGTANISVRYLGVPASNISTAAYRTVTEFTATAGQTSFSTPSYTVGFINVYRNGVLLGSADYTATTGTTVVLASGATAGDLVTTESFYVSSIYNAISNTAGSVNANNIADGAVGTAEIDSNYALWNKSSSDVYYSAGNVGIGAAPTAGYGRLQVKNSYIYVNEDGADTRQLYLRTNYTSEPAIQVATNNPLLFATNNTERMRIDSSGRVTTPYQPAFYAQMNNTDYGTGTNTMVFEDVYVNIGSYYNNTNGRFTAPVAGTYHFSANFLKRSSSGRLVFQKNGSYYGSGSSQTYSGNVGSGEIPHAATIIITLAVGDYVTVVASVDGGDVYGNSNCHNGFSGFLIG